mmetsp:Transcript_27513/g.33386  ORF Transcript_27513/g.33386 Transcript_27513/m.33386 type:complete len:215 (-) Transcript_27513:121-765(-)|eukprot:CAMPEP_0172496990 /NCGR_PEP_ID=MMETSP1066-20121228/94734_1 /TAXON_ID=671091 /ORGANISM="Coscinodiscus wailesii, Strain CCMP2513" /LENGTH=214 /DNA_ID=CAMNT_0013269559 /DNA_START=37 /DNA_END=684 /DNA_ORIENTATION=-
MTMIKIQDVLAAGVMLLLTTGTLGFIPSNLCHESQRTFLKHTDSLYSTKEGNNPEIVEGNRRAFLTSSALTLIGTSCAFVPPATAAAPAASSKQSMIEELKASRQKLETVPDLLQQEKWDEVRTILKTPPINYLWNMGDSKNVLVSLAKATDEFELLDLKDELSVSLQMCDQLTYDNVFVYFQPGSGKVKIKEPVQLAKKAIQQIDEALVLAGQ